jgi:hypothetical protein
VISRAFTGPYQKMQVQHGACISCLCLPKTICPPGVLFCIQRCAGDVLSASAHPPYAGVLEVKQRDVCQAQEEVVYLFYATSRAKCWWIGEGGMHWACGGDIHMQHSQDSGATWSSAKVAHPFLLPRMVIR